MVWVDKHLCVTPAVLLFVDSTDLIGPFKPLSFDCKNYLLLSPLLPLPGLCNLSWYSFDCSYYSYHWCPHETKTVDNSQWTELGLIESWWLNSLIQMPSKHHTPLESASGQLICAFVPLKREVPTTITCCFYLVALVVILGANSLGRLQNPYKYLNKSTVTAVKTVQINIVLNVVQVWLNCLMNTQKQLFKLPIKIFALQKCNYCNINCWQQHILLNCYVLMLFLQVLLMMPVICIIQYILI